VDIFNSTKKEFLFLHFSTIFFTVVPCILILSKFYYQLMHKRIALKGVLKFTLKRLQHVSVQSPSSGSAILELAKVTILKQSIKMCMSAALTVSGPTFLLFLFH
jgi:hypothetical protein